MRPIMTLLTGLLLSSGNAPLVTAADASRALFEKRISPILQSPKASSCAECHLSGVDLKDYIRPTERETFVALKSAGLIDVNRPRASKLLDFIRRAPEKSPLITQKVRDEELAAFIAWIEAAVADPALKNAKAEQTPIGPTLPEEVIRHTRRDAVLRQFDELVWSEVARCAGCHSPKQNQQQVAKHGQRVSWIVPDDAAATLQKLVDAGIIDIEKPAESLLLAKPLMKVPHGGGQKMLIGDRSYQQFRSFLEDYAKAVQGGYRAAEQLPQPSAELGRATDIWLKLTEVPAEWDGLHLQVDLYRADPQAPGGWSRDRYATSDRAVFGKGKLWQHSLSVTAPRDAARARQLGGNSLPSGRYQLVVRLDKAKRLQQDPTAQLGDGDIVGRATIDSRWPAGYGAMTTIRCPVTP